MVEYEWGTGAQHLVTGRKGAGKAGAAVGTGYGVVICADCVYAGASVEPLLASLCEVGYFVISCGVFAGISARWACCPTGWLYIPHVVHIDDAILQRLMLCYPSPCHEIRPLNWVVY